jgi:hypothetical protein
MTRSDAIQKLNAAFYAIQDVYQDIDDSQSDFLDRYSPVDGMVMDMITAIEDMPDNCFESEGN